MKGGLGHRSRRQSAFKLLEEELQRGTKPEKINKRTTKNMIPLTEKDKTRIKVEMENISKKK